MGFVIFWALFTGGGLLVCQLFKKDFALALPVFLTGTILVLYLFGIFGALAAGVYAVCLLALAGFVLVARQCLVQRNMTPLLEKLFTPGYLVFLLILLFVFLGTRNQAFTWSDEITFWGLAVKESLRLDVLYNNPATILDHHLEYPPGLINLEYMWCKLAGGYSEVSVYRALHSFAFLMYLPVFHRARWNQPGKILALLAIIFVLPAPGGGNMIYLSAYVDTTLAVLLGYAVHWVLREGRPGPFRLLAMFLAAFAACQAKSMGYFVVALAGLLVLFQYLARRRGAKDRAKKTALRTEALWKLAPYLAAALLSLVSWTVYRAAMGIGGTAFDVGQISPGQVLAIFTGGGTELQQGILTNFVDFVFTQDILTYAFTGMTFFSLLVLCCLVCVLGMALSKTAGRRRNMLALGIVAPVGALLYALALLVLYLFTFHPHDAYTISSGDRYLGTYIIALQSLILFCGAVPMGRPAQQPAPAGARRGLWPAIALFCVLFLLSSQTIEFALSLRSKRSNPEFTPYSQGSQSLLDSGLVNVEADKVYIIHENPGTFTGSAFAYYTSPLSINQSGFDLTAEATGYGGLIQPMTPAQWQALLQQEGYTHVFVHILNDAFIESFADMFGGGEQLVEGGVYRVVQAGNGVELALEEQLHYSFA